MTVTGVATEAILPAHFTGSSLIGYTLYDYMNNETRQQLAAVVRDIQTREVITFLYRDHPHGASFAALQEMLFLYDAFDESRLTQLVDQKLLAFDGKRYKVAADARQVLDRDPTILMDEFLR